MPVRNKVLGFLFGLTLITYLDRVAISATATVMSTELGLDKAQLGDIFSAFVLGYVIFEIPGGWLADRFGARTLLTRIVLWWSAFTAFTGLAWSYGSLWWIRFFFGCGEAGAFPASASAISRWFPFSERGRAQAVIMVGSRIGAAFAPGLVIALMSLTGWRPVFWIFAGLGVIWAGLWQRWYHNTPEEHPLVTAAELETISAGRVTESHSKADWGALIRSRNVWMLCLMYSGYTWGLYFYLTWLPTYLQEGRNIEWGLVGIAAAIPFLVAAASNYFGGWLTDRLARRLPLRWARRGPAVIGLVAAAIFIAIAAEAESNTVALTALALSFGCSDLILPICWATCLDVGREQAGLVSGTMNSLGQLGAVAAPAVIGRSGCWATCLDVGREQAGLVSGTMNSLGQLGAVAAPAVIGRIVEATGSWELPLLISAAYYLVSAAAWLGIDAERPLRTR